MRSVAFGAKFARLPGESAGYIGPCPQPAGARRRSPLATPNYSYEKRQRELAKKRKAEEKRQRKLNGKPGDDAPQDEAGGEPGADTAATDADPAEPQT